MEYKKENKIKQMCSLIVLVILLCIAGGYFWNKNKQTPVSVESKNLTVATTKGLTYQTKEICESSTGKKCSYQICIQPPSMQVCKINFEKGWYPTGSFAWGPVDENNLADWKTYKNDKYGFEFKNGEIKFELKYPPTIEVIKDIPGYYERQVTKLEVRPDTTGPGPNMNPDYYRIDYFLSFDGISGIKISPYTSNSQPAYDSKDFVGAVKLIVGDRQAVQRITQSEENLFIDTYVFVDSITFDIGYAGENKPEFISLYNQILSTFKFTK